MSNVAGARETLDRAASAWALRSVRFRDWDDNASEVRARYTANCLRELDGFLRLLLDAVAPMAGPARRNTANTLHALVRDDRAAASHAPIRLRALGRTSACLLHCNGWVRRPDETAGTWMTAGWPEKGGDDLRRYPLGERLRPGPAEVANVCAFYLNLAATVG